MTKKSSNRIVCDVSSAASAYRRASWRWPLRRASAQSGHRARLSQDLAERIAQRVEASTDVIVSASDAAIDQLVARYGARLKKRIHGGAVLEATGGQIDAISQDTDIDHMAGDATVYRMMAVTTRGDGRGPGVDGRSTACAGSRATASASR